MQYILEITKIIDGGVCSDRQKVIGYAEQLARKLQQDGDASAAKRIRECIAQRGAAEMAANDLAPPTRLPVDSESRLHLADEIKPLSEPPFVALSPDNHAVVEQFVRYVVQADKLLAGGIGISPSMLIYGPPGLGKTALAKHVASRLNLPLLVARSDSLISSYLGSTAKNLRTLFEHAMSRPSLLFLDEFDAFAKLRDDQHELGELKRVVVSLLQNIDALDGRTVLLAASNHEHLLDSAVWRRFAYKLQMSLPAEDERARMIKHFTKGYASDDLVALFAQASETLSGAQIRHIAEDAIRDAILAGVRNVDESTVLRRIIVTRLPKDGRLNGNSDEILARAAHEIQPQVFNGIRLATMFGKAPSTISRWLRG